MRDLNDMRDGLKDLYKDMYGSDDDSAGSGSGKPGGDSIKPGGDSVKPILEGDGPRPGGDAFASGNKDEQQTETAMHAAEQTKKPKEPEKTGMEELHELVGLKTVKHDVEELIGLVKVRKMREEKGMKAVPVSLHLVFSGNPGTGKTTVARILAKLYKEIGILSKGQLVETDRAGLVAGYVGQTAIKTKEKIEEAMGGVLFIDEAYMLNTQGENYGQESIDTILKAMEDHRDKFVVIVAGYTELMKDFIESNPGLKSRFNKFFEFPDYTVDELQQIFKLQCDKYQYKLTEEAEAAVRKEIILREATKGENFANAREVRNLFEMIITNQAARVAELEDVDEETLTTITIDDLKEDELEEGGAAEEGEPGAAEEGEPDAAEEGNAEGASFRADEPDEAE